MTTVQSPKVQIPQDLQEGTCYESTIGVGDQVAPGAVIEIAKQFKLYQIVQSSSHDNETELLASELMLEKPKRFMDFPLSSILDPENASQARENELRVLNRPFTHGGEKNALLSEVCAKVLEISKSESLTNDIQLSIDELFTNAVYNAPYVKFEKNGAGRPRDEATAKTDILRPGEIFIGHTPSRLIIGCVDQYGALNPDCLIRRLTDCFQRGADQAMNMGPGGAGIGMFLIYQFSCSMYVGVTAGEKTVICCAFSLDRRAKVRASVPKNLHLCVQINSEEKKGQV